MSDPSFHQLVQEALALIPEEFRPYLENVAVIVEEEPDRATRRRLGLEADEWLFGLYVGVPRIARGHDEPLLPDRILIYRRPLMEAYPDPEELKREVAVTVLHEVAHAFGLDEDRLRELGWG
ncbi:MAG TPA: metallopeptidase family protein [Holophagaceae bacterium]|nr:metallopeptidase family protein [Holophagaceae bacterium]